MKISIITPIYNEAQNIQRYFNAILKLDYNKSDYEIVFINDGSQDNSLGLIKKIKSNNTNINIEVVSFEKNKGRAISREQGAKKSKYDNLLFLDAKCEIFPDALNVINDKKYSPIVGNAIQKQSNLIDKFLYIIRKKLFKDSFGEKYEDIYIDKNNFNDISKGTTIFFVEKDVFLSSIPKEKGKNVSDDTKLLENIIKNKKILKTSDLKIFYNVREGFIENIIHIFNRGPKFIDFYYKKENKYFWIINIVLIFLLIFLYFLFIEIKILLLVILCFVLLGIYFSKNIKDFGIFLLLAPIIFSTFLLGLIKGIFLKVTNQLGK